MLKTNPQDLSGEESGTLSLLRKPCAGAAKHTGPRKHPASKGKQVPDRLQCVLHTQM